MEEGTEEERGESMKTIIVESRSDDYKACLAGHKEFWECGKTPQSAIGNLLISHLDQFPDIDIKFDEVPA